MVSSGNGITVKIRDRKYVLDPQRPARADAIFVSHAHVDHLHSPGLDTPLIASKETGLLAKARGYELGPIREEFEGFELYDSGHILGSRAALIEGEVFYTGDFAGRPRGFMGKGRVARSPILIVEATYGLDRYIFPAVGKIVDEVNRLIASLFAKGVPVVLMGYPLGKAQLLTYLFSSWEPIYLHSSIRNLNRVYRALGVDLREDLISYTEAQERGLLDRRPWILLTPAFGGRSPFIRRLKGRYGAVTILFTGWAIDNGYKYARAVDYAFPLSDHCDHRELLELVRAVNPEKVYTVHGFAVELAAELRRYGYDAEPLLGVQASMMDYVK
jgi:putative mRNA 3-end processing factor